MESLGEEPWDAVICGTGLQQSLLALALSRSKKRILHLDPNDYYGQHEAAFSLQEAESWADANAPTSGAGGDATVGGQTAEEATSSAAPPQHQSIFRNASVWKHPEAEEKGLSFSRAYTVALAPHIIHTRAKVLAQLVSSRAYRQVDFLAVGSFFVYEPTSDEPKLVRIPSSREDVFSSTFLPARSKRSLMKFLKFVVDYDSEEQRPTWQARADDSLADFLSSEFRLDDSLRKSILALTLTLDGQVNVKDGLHIINRHLTSMGLFGPGFCAVYPKWGGISEIAQVACRAGAVGGGIYMLGTSMDVSEGAEAEKIPIRLSNGIDVQTSTLFSRREDAAADALVISRLVAIINSPLAGLFETVVEGAPTPAVAVVAFPGGSVLADGGPPNSPIYAFIHSSDTGECPKGQSLVYLTTTAEATSKQRLQLALDVLLETAASGETSLASLYQLYYEQAGGQGTPLIEKRGPSSVFSFPPPPLSLALDDSQLEDVKSAWKLAMGDEVLDEDYMVFEDREGADADDEVYD